MSNDFRQQAETLAFAAADTVKLSQLIYSRFGFPFTHLRFTKSGAATAATVVISAGISGKVFLSITEAGAETFLVEALLDGVVAVPTLWHDMAQVAAATNITGAALVDGDYVMALGF